MEQYGLLGYPLGHSFSARYFSEKFEAEGRDAVYRNFEYEAVGQGVDALLSVPDLCGFNVTIPHKRSILPYLSALSPEARQIGAVNVVKPVREEGRVRLVGYNTDVIGFVRSIRPLLRAGVHTRALVLGTGGASRAVVYGLQRLGLQVTGVSRRPSPSLLTYDDLTPEVMAARRVIVNCTPLGMYPAVDSAPAVPYRFLTPGHVLYDLVYNPGLTAFMRHGQRHGAVVKNGLEMLHLQAEAAWDIWTGRAPVEVI